MCLLDGVQECFWIQEVTGEVWIGLEQNIIDIAVNERLKHLHAFVRTMAHCSSNFAVGSWKMKQLDEVLCKVSRKITKYVFVHYLD